MHFTEHHPKAGKDKYMDPYVAPPSSFATLRILPAGSEHPRKPGIWLSGDPADARKTAQPQGDTLGNNRSWDTQEGKNKTDPLGRVSGESVNPSQDVGAPRGPLGLSDWGLAHQTIIRVGLPFTRITVQQLDSTHHLTLQAGFLWVRCYERRARSTRASVDFVGKLRALRTLSRNAPARLSRSARTPLAGKERNRDDGGQTGQ